MHIIQLLEFPCTFTYQTSWENNNIYKLYILPYHKCQLVLKSLHTLLTYTSQYSFTRHSNRMTYSMFDILSIQYKPQSNKNRDIHIPDVITPSSTPLTPAACPSGFIINQMARDPSPIFSVGSWHLCVEGPLGLWSTFFTSDSLPWPHVVCAHPESWQKEHYYILYLKSPSYSPPSWHRKQQYTYFLGQEKYSWAIP